MNRDELDRVESSYHVDRAAIRRVLEEALDQQRRMEELAEKHSCELPAWVDLAARLEARRAQSAEAVERIIAETLELDEAVFGAVSRAECVEILRALGGEFDRALTIRLDSAQLLISFARAYRSDGYNGSEIVDRALKRLVSQLVDTNHVPLDLARQYVALLAWDYGAIPAGAGDPQTALATHLDSSSARFPDLTERLKANRWRESGKSFEEIANDVQQTALGLWPKTIS